MRLFIDVNSENVDVSGVGIQVPTSFFPGNFSVILFAPNHIRVNRYAHSRTQNPVTALFDASPVRRCTPPKIYQKCTLFLNDLFE